MAKDKKETFIITVRTTDHTGRHTERGEKRELESQLTVECTYKEMLGLAGLAKIEEDEEDECIKHEVSFARVEKPSTVAEAGAWLKKTLNEDLYF